MENRLDYRCPNTNQRIYASFDGKELWFHVGELGTLFKCKRPALVKALRLLVASRQLDPAVDFFPSQASLDDYDLRLSRRAAVTLGYCFDRMGALGLFRWAATIRSA